MSLAEACHLAGMKAEKARKPKKASRTTKQKKAGAGAKKSTAPKFAPRADFGAPIEGFFAKQPAHLRSILEELRKLVEEAAPEAQSSLDQLPRDAVRDWLRKAAEVARLK